eukprot:Tamp_24596.p1 GENE.Tamp_24596~~Tamp_24596.p1  ORF type:complete len:323 (-),score=44.17 Tamp_24596:12-953(-)
MPPDSDSNEENLKEMCEKAAAAGWREGLPFGGWGSAEAAARARAEGWKGGAALGDEDGLGVTNEIEDSEHWDTFPPHMVEFVKRGRPPGVPYNAFGGAPSGGPTKMCDSWGERLGPNSSVVKINPDDFVTYTHDGYRPEEVGRVLADDNTERYIIYPHRGDPYEFRMYAQGIDDVIVEKRNRRMAVSPQDYGYYDEQGRFQTPHERLGLRPGETADVLDEHEAWQEWLAPRKKAMDAAFKDPATRPRWARIFEAAFQVGAKMLQQMEGFLATRGSEPVFSFPLRDVLRNLTHEEQEGHERILAPEEPTDARIL